MTAATAPLDRPLRRDAAENRARVLAAATQVFTEQGLGASVEEVARVAGVGMGTLYRRFATKDALIGALVAVMLQETLELAEQARAIGGGRGLESFLETSSAYQAEHVGCLDRLWEVGPDEPSVRAIRRTIDRLLADAKARGRVRAEIANTDVTMVMWSIRGVIRTSHRVAPHAWRRHLDLLLAGLRPAGEPLGHPPLTRAQVDAVVGKV
ncbi:MAG TPA: TetR/AcrR family transcriptional regulator [Mycobacteriales bacterium]|nr:TetR/AcrR family transcriptional regulator [Mycobacteriales bacterium]